MDTNDVAVPVVIPVNMTLDWLRLETEVPGF